MGDHVGLPGVVLFATFSFCDANLRKCTAPHSFQIGEIVLFATFSLCDANPRKCTAPHSFQIGEIITCIHKFFFFQNHTMTYTTHFVVSYYIILQYWSTCQNVVFQIINKSCRLLLDHPYGLHFRSCYYISSIFRLRRMPSLSSTALVVLRGVHRRTLHQDECKSLHCHEEFQ